MRFVDSNVFLRHLAQDDSQKAVRCLAFFERLERGEEEATTSEAIVAEVVFVLAGKVYQQARAEIQAALLPLLLAKGMHLSDRWTIVDALAVYITTSLDFADALAAAHVFNRELDAVLSYDRDFDKVPGLVREEP